jgi:hypothetical protein
MCCHPSKMLCSTNINSRQKENTDIIQKDNSLLHTKCFKNKQKQIVYSFSKHTSIEVVLCYCLTKVKHERSWQFKFLEIIP